MKILNVSITKSGLTLTLQDISKLGTYNIYYDSDFIEEITPGDEAFDIFVSSEYYGKVIYLKSKTFTNLIVLDFKYIESLIPTLLEEPISVTLEYNALDIQAYPVQMNTSSIDTILIKENVNLNTEFLDNYNRGFNEGFIFGQLL